ncbi:MAG: phosphoribosyltransferase family protein [Legionellaceae bacterium]|nr:phosphoribosyltransferase family protein [Legionellaceae bacterium]
MEEITEEITNIENKLEELYVLKSEIGARVEACSTLAVDNSGHVLSRENISLRINGLAHQIIDRYKEMDCSSPPVLLSLMDGALPFTAELQKALNDLNFAFEYATMQTKSYTRDESGSLTITSEPKCKVGARYVFVLDDVYDKGNTFAGVEDYLRAKGAKGIDLVALVNKDQVRQSSAPNWGCYGFEMSANAFIIGFGLDYDGTCRNGQDITIVDPNTLQTQVEVELLSQINPLTTRLEELISLKHELSSKKSDSVYEGVDTLFANTSDTTIDSNGLPGLRSGNTF